MNILSIILMLKLLNMPRKIKSLLVCIIAVFIAYSGLLPFLYSGTDVFKIIHLPKPHKRSKQVASDRNIYVAVVDTGFDARHPAYNKNVSKNYLYSTDLTADIREVPRYVKGQYQLTHHGTHIVGILCGQLGQRSNGSYAFEGIAPHVKVILTQILPYASSTEVAQAFHYLATTPAEIVSISMSFAPNDQPIPADIARALLQLVASNKIVVLAAGNTGTYFESNIYSQSLVSLASRARGRIILAGASDHSWQAYIRNLLQGKPSWDALATFSARPYFSINSNNFICAPGVDIRSSITNPFWNTKLMSGTSMSAPIISGALACILQFYPDIDQAAQLLFQYARRTDSYGRKFSTHFGSGIVDLSFLKY